MRGPRYLIHQTRKRFYYARHPNVPWIVPDAVRFLDRILQPDWVLFEFGSGRSTAWFAQRVRRVISIEQDRTWYALVANALRSTGLQKKVDLRHVPLNHPKDAPTGAHYDPLPEYVAEATALDDASVDVCLVDGHYRHACVLAIVPKVRPGGFLIIDNSNWVGRGQWEVPDTWPEVGRFRFAADETTIWRKPRPGERLTA